MSRVHWLGTGLSSVPGLRKLLTEHHDIFVWNRTIEKAKALVGDLTGNIYEFDLDEIEKKISTGDILVSMLPANQHLDIARLCLKKKAKDFQNFTLKTMFRLIQ